MSLVPNCFLPICPISQTSVYIIYKRFCSGSGINMDNVHYYISLASYRSPDGSVEAGQPVVKQSKGQVRSAADDANVRCQATLALGCCTDKDPTLRTLTVERITANLDDRDRLVREAASRALGRLKAVRSVPKLISVW